jgi:DNA repair protein RadD
MTFKLRPYQSAAVDSVYQYWADKRGDNPLIVAPTGAGKTAVIAQIIRDAMSFPGTKVMVLTHVKELLEQGAQGLLRMYPEADIGFYSASIGQKRLDKPITFAGIQSVWKRATEMIPAPDLVLIDEAHMLPKNTETRYGHFIKELKLCNPHVKIVGLTATPYRLDSGYLHKGEGAIFDGIAYDIPVGMLMDEGYLSPIISKGGLQQIDLTNVGKRGGEFIESQLAEAASDPDLVRSMVNEIVSLGKDRKSWLIFASGLDHAGLIQAEMLNHNIICEVVSGEDSQSDRAAKIGSFKRGQTRAVVNVGVLTTGFDHPGVDLVAMARATESTGLYIQIVGRGTRPVYASGYDLDTKDGRVAAIANGTKPNCLVLDFGQNVQRHGFIDSVKPMKSGGGGTGGEAPTKQCPSCQSMCFAGLRVCPECSHEFPPPEVNHSNNSYSGAMLSTQVEAEWLPVTHVMYQRWKKEGKPDSIKVTYTCGMLHVNEWLCPDHGGYAASRYKARMSVLGATAETTEEALEEADSWIKPSNIKVKPLKYPEIVQFDYSSKENPNEGIARDAKITYSQKEKEFEEWISLDDIPF